MEWETLTEEERERLLLIAFPEQALERVLEARRDAESWEDLCNQALELIRELRASIVAGTEHANRVIELEAKIAAATRREGALDQRAATAENKKRRDDLDQAIEHYVRGRVRKDATLLAKELAVEIRSLEWAAKNKKGGRYSFETLHRKVGPALKRAKADLRRGKL